MIKTLYSFTRYFDERFRFLRTVPPAATLLDCGCGNFVSSGKLIKQRPDIAWHGIDLYAPTQIPNNVTFNQVDLEKDRLPFHDNFFDAAYILHVVEHLACHERFVAELSRVIKPSGTMYIETPSVWSILAPTSKKFFAKTGNFYDDVTHRRPFTLPSLHDYVVFCMGMEVIKCGVVRNWTRIAALPLLIPYSLFKWRAYFMMGVSDIIGYRLFAIVKNMKKDDPIYIK